MALGVGSGDKWKNKYLVHQATTKPAWYPLKYINNSIWFCTVYGIRGLMIVNSTQLNLNPN